MGSYNIPGGFPGLLHNSRNSLYPGGFKFQEYSRRVIIIAVSRNVRPLNITTHTATDNVP